MEATTTASFSNWASMKSVTHAVNSAIKASVLPLLGIVCFLLFWHASASSIVTSLGQFPGPVQVWEQSANLVVEHREERAKEIAFYERQEVRNAKKISENPDAKIKVRAYTGKATFVDQIFTSLYTVAFGFFVASIIAIPLGIVCGLS